MRMLALECIDDSVGGEMVCPQPDVPLVPEIPFFPTEIPFTGISIGEFLVIGAALLLLGIIVVGVRRFLNDAGTK